MSDKNLYIIAGCNGAGKTTASFTILPVKLLYQQEATSKKLKKQNKKALR